MGTPGEIWRGTYPQAAMAIRYQRVTDGRPMDIVLSELCMALGRYVASCNFCTNFGGGDNCPRSSSGYVPEIS